MAACSDGSQRSSERRPQLTDSLYTADAAMAVYADDPDRAIALLDSSLAIGNIKEGLALMLKAKVYSQSTAEQRLDSARIILEGLMESDYVDKPAQKEEVLDLLVSVSRQQSNHEQCLRWATQKANLCRQQGEETEALRTEAEIGVILVELGDEEKGLAKLNGVISALDGQHHVDEMDACIIALRRKISALKSLDREPEVIPLAHRIIDILNYYRDHREEYDNNSYRIPKGREHVDAYCDFYTAQAQGYLAFAFATVADHMAQASHVLPPLLVKQPRDSARRYLALVEQSNYGRTFMGRRSLAPTWCLMGEYDKMLAIYDEMQAQMGADTMNVDYLDILRGRAIAAEARGNIYAALSFWRRHAALDNVLDRQERRSKAHEYAVRYQLHEQQLKAENEKQRAETYKYLMILCIVLILLSASFITWLVLHHRSINRKNRVLVAQIAEAVKYKQIVDNTHVDRLISPDGSPNGAGASQHLDPTAKLEELSDEELYAFLSDAIRRERLFTDPNFGRQTLMDRYNINERRIGAAFARGGSYNSLPDFVCSLRLECACQLLTDRDDMNISEIATACGFSNASVFSREFKRRLEVTPTYYRQQMATAL